MTHCDHLDARRSSVAVAIVAAASLSFTSGSFADEGGVSFWLPGQFGSLAALPGTPGWTLAALYYHSSVEAGASRSFNRGGSFVAGLDARVDLAGFGPTYVFATPVLGAQASLGVLGLYGRSQASIDATLTGPLGNTISGHRTDTLYGFSDLFLQGALKWNFGVHNVMTYMMGNIPVGAYDPGRLANIGLGHAAVDWGAGYTFFNPQAGFEFSAVTGFTYNFENPDTQYQNGIDWHLDWGVSQFLNKQVHVGLVGYLFHQLTGDSGAGANLGDFKSRVAGIGPQIGFMFPVGDMQGYMNLRGYKEFAAENRPEGWNVWLTFALSPRAATEPSAPALTRKY